MTTSPANYQAWAAVKDAPVEKEAAKAFVRRLLKGIGGADKSATGSTRTSCARRRLYATHREPIGA
jgi:hypothetical protein